MATFVLVTFAAAAMVGVDTRIDTLFHATRPEWLVASVCLILLAGDAALPIPSTATMTACGAAIGTTGGTIVGLVGGTVAAYLCYIAGQRLGLLKENQSQRRWMLAVAATRGIPVAAEVVAVSAGRSRLRWAQFLLAAGAGQLPVAFVCSLLGSRLAG